MDFIYKNKRSNPLIDIRTISKMIADIQEKSGAIPWCHEEKTDPWDHVEAAMGLCIGGYLKQARRAYEWMARTQQVDGSWYASYKNGIPEDTTKDSNTSSYIAVGLFHYYLITGDKLFLKNMWPTVKSAINFALSMQAPGGEIYWAISPKGRVDPAALLTGSSSVYMSIKCAFAIARILGHHVPDWKQKMLKLKNALRNKPAHFDMTKSRYSMDWFYPVLCGALTGQSAQKRIDQYWKKFIISGKGVRCVSDRPWVTVAETCELSLTLAAMGNMNLAGIVFGWIQDKTNPNGSYWCGFTCPDMTIWPEDQTTWTNAVVLIAADALYNFTPAHKLFHHNFWENSLCKLKT